MKCNTLRSAVTTAESSTVLVPWFHAGLAVELLFEPVNLSWNRCRHGGKDAKFNESFTVRFQIV